MEKCYFLGLLNSLDFFGSLNVRHGGKEVAYGVEIHENGIEIHGDAVDMNPRSLTLIWTS